MPFVRCSLGLQNSERRASLIARERVGLGATMSLVGWLYRASEREASLSVKLMAGVVNYYIIHTEPRKSLGTWLREFSSCSCLIFLPGLAWVLLSKICKDFFSALYGIIAPNPNHRALIFSIANNLGLGLDSWRGSACRMGPWDEN